MSKRGGNLMGRDRGVGGGGGGGWMVGNWRGTGVIRICCENRSNFVCPPASIDDDVSCHSVPFPMFQVNILFGVITKVSSTLPRGIHS